MTDKHPQIGRVAEKITAWLKAAEELAALKRIWEGSPNYGVGALLEALNLCVDHGASAPLWLARAICEELIYRVPKKMTLIHYRRWREVRKMRDERPHTVHGRPGQSYPGQKVPHREISYEATFEWVGDRLRNTSAAGSPKVVRDSYQRVEKDLPKALRYKRTYTKRTR